MAKIIYTVISKGIAVHYNVGCFDVTLYMISLETKRSSCETVTHVYIYTIIFCFYIGQMLLSRRNRRTPICHPLLWRNLIGRAHQQQHLRLPRHAPISHTAPPLHLSLSASTLQTRMRNAIRSTRALWTVYAAWADVMSSEGYTYGFGCWAACVRNGNVEYDYMREAPS